MHITARVFWTPKAGNRVDEYEDAYWPVRTVNRTGERFRFAVADGATETSFSGLWARQLVQCYGSGCFGTRRQSECLQREQAAWQAEVARRPLPWYAEEKARHGAYAALLGFEVAEGKDAQHHTWQAIAVGDCTLLQWREGDPVAAFPAQDAAFFTSRPYLIASNPHFSRDLAEQVQAVSGECRAGDCFWLMSDALGQWALRSLEQGKSPWPVMRRFQTGGSQRAFARWSNALRSSGELRNDDMTFYLIVVN